MDWREEHDTVEEGDGAGAGEATVTAPIERDGFAGRVGLGAGWWF